VPVVSGNVSLYYETDGRAIPRTLLEIPRVELLTRVFADGRSEEALRMPVPTMAEESDAT
jgi:phosphoribosylformylglycinamidine (FGAM) synthase-like enzyme